MISLLGHGYYGEDNIEITDLDELYFLSLIKTQEDLLIFDEVLKDFVGSDLPERVYNNYKYYFLNTLSLKLIKNKILIIYDNGSGIMPYLIDEAFIPLIIDFLFDYSKYWIGLS